MRKVLITLLMSATTLVAQVTVTPNIGLQVPYYNQQNWQVPIQYDLNLLDLLISGNSPYNGVNKWSATFTYQAGAIVTYNGAVYISLQSSNLDYTPSTYTTWWYKIPTTTGGGNNIVPGANITCSPLVAGSCVGSVTVSVTGLVGIPNGGTGNTLGAEPPLGNPLVDGYVVSSTRAGVRSWIANGSMTYPGANTIAVGNSANNGWTAPSYTNITALWTAGTGALYSDGTFHAIPTVGTWGALNYPSWASGTPFVKMTAAGTFALDTNTYLTGVTADSPLSGSGTSGSHLAIQQANTSQGGYLSSTDWNTFNGKQAALTLLKGTYVDGDLCTYAASGTLLNCNTPNSGGLSISGPVGSAVAITGTFPGTGTALASAPSYITLPGLVYGSCSSAPVMTANTTALNTALAAGYIVGIANNAGGNLCVNGIVTCSKSGCGLVGYGSGAYATYPSVIQQTANTDGVVVGMTASTLVSSFYIENLNIIGPGSGSGTRVGLHLTNGSGSYGGGAGVIKNVYIGGFSQAIVNNYFDQMTVSDISGGSDGTNAGLPIMQITGGTANDSSKYDHISFGCNVVGSPTADFEDDGAGVGAVIQLGDMDCAASVAGVIINGASRNTYFIGDFERLNAPRVLVENSSAVATVFGHYTKTPTYDTTAPIYEVTTGAQMLYRGASEATTVAATNYPVFTLSTTYGGIGTLTDSTQYCYVLPGYNTSGHTSYPEQCITTGSHSNTNNVVLTITPLPGITTMVPGRGATGAEHLFSTVSLPGNTTTWTDDGTLTPAGALLGASTLLYPQFYTDSASDGSLIADVVVPGGAATSMIGMWAKSNGQIYPAPGHVLSYPVSTNASDGSARQTFARKFDLAVASGTNTQLVTVTTAAGSPGNAIAIEATLVSNNPIRSNTKYLCYGYANSGVLCYETETTETPASQKLSISTSTSGTNSFSFYVFNTDTGYARTGVLELSNLNYGGSQIQSVTIGAAVNGTPTAAGWSAFGGNAATAATAGGAPPTGSASGDLSGSYPGPTVAKINGVSFSASPSAGMVPNTTSGSASSWTATPTLGAAGTLGSLTFGNATSGLLTLETATGAITSYTLQLPVAQPAGSNTYLSCTAANPAVCTWAAGGGGGGLSGMTAGQLAVAATASTVTSSIAYATTNTASTIVERDGSSNINATTFTGALSAPTASTMTQTGNTVPVTIYGNSNTSDNLEVYAGTGVTPGTKAFWITGGSFPQVHAAGEVDAQYFNASISVISPVHTGGSTYSSIAVQGGSNGNIQTTLGTAFLNNVMNGATGGTQAQLQGTFCYSWNCSGNGTTTTNWTGFDYHTIFGSGTSDIYNGATPMKLLSLTPTINIGTGSTSGYVEIASLPVETSIGTGVTNYFIKHAASGGSLATPNFAVQENGFLLRPGEQSIGTKFTTSGCAVSSTTGGATAGIFTLGANSCTVVITMNGASGLTATNGWTCQAHDRTAPTILIGGESSSNSTTASITIPAGAGATDVISFSCTAY